MSSQLNFFSESFRAAQDLSNSQQLFVTVDSTGRAWLAQPNQEIEGVLENSPLQNLPATVSYLGITKVQTDNNYAIGTYVTSGVNGIATAATTGTYPYIRGKLIESADASGNFATIRLIDGLGIQGIQGATGLQGIQGVTGVHG